MNQSKATTVNGSEPTTRELAAQLEQLTRLVTAQVHAVEALTTSGAVARVAGASTKSNHAERIMTELATCNGGRPGSLSTVELQKRLGLTRGVLWHHLNGLIDNGQVWAAYGKRGADGRRGPAVIFHAEAVAV